MGDTDTFVHTLLRGFRANQTESVQQTHTSDMRAALNYGMQAGPSALIRRRIECSAASLRPFLALCSSAPDQAARGA